MALTRLDCDFFRSTGASSDTSSCVAFNPRMRPGSFVVAAAVAAKSSLGGQIACKLSLEHFSTGVLEFYQEPRKINAEDLSQAVLEHAFKRSNQSVYEFGHKLAAGGRMAAMLLGVVIEERVATVGRVGAWSAYLFRENQLYPFFEDAQTPSGGFVGEQSLVRVETASVPVEGADKIFVFSAPLDRAKEVYLGRLASQIAFNGSASQSAAERLFAAESPIDLALAVQVGPEAIYLSEPVVD